MAAGLRLRMFFVVGSWVGDTVDEFKNPAAVYKIHTHEN